MEVIIEMIVGLLALLYLIAQMALWISMSSKLGQLLEESRRHTLLLSKLLKYVSERSA